MSEILWDPLSVIAGKSEAAVAVIKLNTPLDITQGLVRDLWQKAVFKAATDGAATALYQGSKTNGCHSLKPDLISGDFDSITKEALEYFKNQGVEIAETPDQNETDFTKCLRLVVQRLKDAALEVSGIFVLGSADNRLDHTMGNINTLFLARQLTDIPVYLYYEQSLACLMTAGRHRFMVNSGLEGDWCGLIPMGHPANHVTTTGLKWNLSDQSMEFGQLISTSNQLDESPALTVETDQSLLWTLALQTDDQYTTFGQFVSTSNQLGTEASVTVETDCPLVWMMGLLTSFTQTNMP